jgi:hypothetical protein
MLKKIEFMFWCYSIAGCFGLFMMLRYLYYGIIYHEYYDGYYFIGFFLFIFCLVAIKKLLIRYERLQSHLPVHDLLNKTTEV